MILRYVQFDPATGNITAIVSGETAPSHSHQLPFRYSLSVDWKKVNTEVDLDRPDFANYVLAGMGETDAEYAARVLVDVPIPEGGGD